ncbi:MAG: orotidine-5'-phosphate decarboxylase [Candidatus Obscuribacterales bacterium]|nr:orotidine-5'-phosphate decarboxylase [Candidatus Obscuribacterales bacterium]
MLSVTHKKDARERLILAVDTATMEEARQLLDELHEYVGVFKIGLQLFTQYGPEILELFQSAERKIFLDCKFLDIPNTVAKACESATALGVSMFTVHAAGGKKMLTAAAEAVKTKSNQLGVQAPMILGVTVLTSMDESTLRNELKVASSVKEQVLNLAALCQQSGINGIVASPEEIVELRAKLGPAASIITPGVRPVWASADDQSRIMTPGEAITNGADYLVVGRPITKAKSPKEAAAKIVDEMQAALDA